MDELPLPYQQILFDSYDAYFNGSMHASGKDQAISTANELGVDITEASPELQSEIEGFADLKRQETIESGILGEDIVDRYQQARKKWSDRVEELGYEEGGSLADFDEWYDPETDFRPLGEELLEEAMLEHRPS